jgi:hypothetical protein
VSKRPRVNIQERPTTTGIQDTAGLNPWAWSFVFIAAICMGVWMGKLIREDRAQHRHSTASSSNDDDVNWFYYWLLILNANNG